MVSAIDRSTVAWIGGSISALIMAAVSLFGVHIAEVTERVDRQAFLSDADALTQGVFLLGEFAAVEQVALVERTEAYENISTRYNPVWVERNLGKDVFADPDEEEVLLVAASGEILHSSSKVHGRPNRVETLRAARLIAAKARQSLNRATAVDAAGRVELTPQLENALYEGVYTHALALLGDVTAIVAAAVVLPNRGDLSSRLDAPVALVSIRPIREDMLAALGRTTQLGSIRFERRKIDDPDLWGRQLASVLGTENSVTANEADTSSNQVFAMWPRKSAGTMVMAAMVPSLIVLASVLVFFALGAIIILRRLAERHTPSEAAAGQDTAASGIEAGVEYEELTAVDALRRKAQDLRGAGSVAARTPSDSAVNA